MENNKQHIIKILGYYLFVLSFTANGGWVRFFGRGVSWTTKKGLSFSKRNGYTKIFRFRKTYFSNLKAIGV